MSNENILVNDAKAQSRHDALLECETRIAKASKDTVESVLVIGSELRKIREGELYEVTGITDFESYVEFKLHMDPVLAHRWMKASKALEVLDQQRLQLPYNESQVTELVKLKEPGQIVTIWQRILAYCHEKNIVASYDLVREAVKAQRTKTGERTPRVGRKHKKKISADGIDIDLGLADGETQTRHRTWSEEGEKALNRIRRLCGDPVADAVDQSKVKITEHDLIAWSEENPEMVKNLSYWIVMSQWTYRKALAYEEELVNEKTTIEQLAEIARSRGGSVYLEWQDARSTLGITLQISPA
jgi:hypothetical protein